MRYKTLDEWLGKIRLVGLRLISAYQIIYSEIKKLGFAVSFWAFFMPEITLLSSLNENWEKKRDRCGYNLLIKK